MQFGIIYSMNNNLLKRIAAVILASALIGCSTASAVPSATPTAGSTDTSFSATFFDAEQSTTGDDLKQLTNLAKDTYETSCWRNDTVLVKAAIYNASDTSSVVAEAGDLTSSSGNTISKNQISIGRIQEVSATDSDSSKTVSVPDIITRDTSVQLTADSIVTWMIKVQIPSNTPAGTYTGMILFHDTACSRPLTLTLHVQDLDLEDSSSMSLELWQYPYSSLRYYNFAQAFSQAHVDYLSKELQLYKEAGGGTITASITDEPWGHQTYDSYPSMIAWTRNADYSWSFDYTQFDTWVNTCMNAGISERILSFSILPTYNRILFDDQVTGQQQTLYLDPGSDDWNTIWGLFLDSYISHLEEQGWFDITYMAIDEKDTASTQAVIDLLDSHTNSNGDSLKLAVYMNQLPEDTSILDSIDEVSFAESVVEEDPSRLQKIADQRTEDGKITSMYTCTDQYPNSFTYSNPAESVWTVLYAKANHMTGFVRWALDAFNEDPFTTTDVDTYESGDTMLLYPGNDSTPYSSTRLELIAEGIRLVNKYEVLSQQVTDQSLLNTADDLMNAIANANVSKDHHDESLIEDQVTVFRTLISSMEDSLNQ